MRMFYLVGVIALSGCAANSGVVQMGHDSYIVTRQAGSGFGGAGTLKADAITEAGEYCKSHGKMVHVNAVSETKPPYILGAYPRAEIQFKCLAAPATN